MQAHEKGPVWPAQGDGKADYLPPDHHLEQWSRTARARLWAKGLADSYRLRGRPFGVEFAPKGFQQH